MFLDRPVSDCGCTHSASARVLRWTRSCTPLVAPGPAEPAPPGGATIGGCLGKVSGTPPEGNPPSSDHYQLQENVKVYNPCVRDHAMFSDISSYICCFRVSARRGAMATSGEELNNNVC